MKYERQYVLELTAHELVAVHRILDAQRNREYIQAIKDSMRVTMTPLVENSMPEPTPIKLSTDAEHGLDVMMKIREIWAHRDYDDWLPTR
jgi:hypothetical protein